MKEYEKFCAPLLHLAGISVTLLVTNKDTDAINMTTKIPKNADAVVIAGGDGTVSEVKIYELSKNNNLIKHQPYDSISYFLKCQCISC